MSEFYYVLFFIIISTSNKIKFDVVQTHWNLVSENVSFLLFAHNIDYVYSVTLEGNRTKLAHILRKLSSNT